MTEHSDTIEIDVRRKLRAVTFSANGEYIVCSDDREIRVWRAEDGKEMATTSTRTVNCLAVSKDGRWIAGGTHFDGLFLWNATTYEQERILEYKSRLIYAVDFSPDSTRLVSGAENTATIWDVSNHKQIQTLDHPGLLFAAKYSSQGDRIATASEKSVRVWDSSDGRLLVEIPVKVTPWYNTGLLWFNDHLFVVVFAAIIEEFDASTGSLVAEWRVPSSDPNSCISLPKHGQFIAYSGRNTVTFWSTSTHTQLAAVQHSQAINSIAFSPGDDKFLAIGGYGGQISIKRLSSIIEPVIQVDDTTSNSPTPSSRLQPTSQEPVIEVGDAASNSPNPLSWKQAVEDANQMITLDPSSPWSYKVMHAALHKGGDYDNAIDALEMMLKKMAESPDPEVQQQGDQYISPSSTRALIRRIVQRTLRRLPRVLINTTTGRLHDRAEQTSVFEALPIFKELVSSTTTRIDYVRIKREVRQYFQYVMLSHKWEDNEPLFQQMVHKAVYDLEKSPTHDKLQTFCRIVCGARFNWAWSDTCCIDKSDHFILQEALVAMFRWYQGSAMVIVFLRGVRPSSPWGALAASIWNTRAWTLQEYIAARVIRFYTEDWTLYRDLDLPNHKESPEIISEMEQATGVSVQQLKELCPGLGSIRTKLRLASPRRTTSVEDAAYSLLGIFSAIGIPAIYGEGEASLGRLLANVLTRSGDASILAWTGESGRFNSCLPARITVFNGPATSHLPPPVPDPELERIITGLRAPSFDLDTALRLYDRLNELPTPRFAESRMTLPCIASQLPPLSASRIGLTRVYRADTIVFGKVEIQTKHNLGRMNSLYLVHPWLDSLLQHGDMHSGTFVEDDEEIFDEDTDNEQSDDDSSLLSERESLSSPAPVQIIPVDRESGARRLVAHLRQPFGALVFTLVSTGQRATVYKRVAADSMITVRFQDNVSLANILDNVRILDVL